MRSGDAAARRGLALAALALALAPAAPAAAYCRTSVCPGAGTRQVCTPAQAGDCGIPLRWPQQCVGFSIQEDASTQVSYAETQAIFEEAFATWMAADCGRGDHPAIRVSNAGPVSCDLHEYNQDRGNANAIIYRDGDWPHPGSGHTLALTTVTYNLDNGEIYDADMELNSADHDFSTGDAAVSFDLLSIATHEAGHFLGLSHSQDTTATMFAGYNEGTTGLRDLTDDDVNGMCAIYPPASISSCDPTPRHGFSPLCADEQPDDDGGCSVTAAGNSRSSGGRGIVALGVLGVLGATARRRGGARRGAARPEPDR